MKHILVIQTAFLGDTVLATSVLEKLHGTYSEAQLDILVRKGNESLFDGHPFLNKVIVWNKKEGKYKSMSGIIQEYRSIQYDAIINLQRFASSGFMTWRLKGKWKSGFNKNPFSFCYQHKARHVIGDGRHEIQRNQELIAPITDDQPASPRLYPTKDHQQKAAQFSEKPYITIAPASVWFTKQFPVYKWRELIDAIPSDHAIYLLGGPGDFEVCQQVALDRPQAKNLAGELSLLETAALMEKASMNYVNDSAPLHIASAMNAPVTAVFCSTIPDFGFTPLSDESHIIETKEQLECRPCGLHGKKSCPKGHFKCADQVEVQEMIIP